MANEMVSLPAAAIPDIRKMLIIGLASLSELERIADHVELSEKCGRKVENDLKPIHPTGAHEGGTFAEALLWLEYAMPAEGN